MKTKQLKEYLRPVMELKRERARQAKRKLRMTKLAQVIAFLLALLLCASYAFASGSLFSSTTQTLSPIKSNGASLTKEFEGFSSTPYICPSGHKTIGYGFNLDEPFIRNIIKSKGFSTEYMTKQQADEVFEVVYAQAEQDAIRWAGRYALNKLSDARRETIVDLAYQLGYYKLTSFRKAKKALLKDDYVGFSNELKDSKWYGQSGRRARHHVQVFKEGL